MSWLYGLWQSSLTPPVPTLFDLWCSLTVLFTVCQIDIVKAEAFTDGLKVRTKHATSHDITETLICFRQQQIFSGFPIYCTR